MEYQRVTYEQLVEAQGRQDELAHQFLDWAQRFRGQADCYHLLMEAYTRLFDEQTDSQSALEFDIVGAAGHPLSLAKLARKAGQSGKTPSSHTLAAFHELEAFLLAKKLEAQVILGQPSAEVEDTWHEWGALIHHCEESPELRAVTAIVLRNMALCYAVHQQPQLANTHYEALMDLCGRHPLETALVQEWSKAIVDLSDIYSTQKDPRRCRQLYDDLRDVLPQCEQHPWLRINLARAARNVVWAYREHSQYDRPASLAKEVLALCDRFAQDKGLHREMARLWVSLSYGYGHRRQWRNCLAMFRTLSEWINQWPNDRHLRLRWMQVGRNLVWGHDGNEGLREVEQVYEAMVAMQQRFPHQAALRTELGWSCVNMSWSYGCERRTREAVAPRRSRANRKPAPVERVVEVVRTLQAAHTSDVELAECFAATCRNWLWSLRDEPGSQPLQAKVVEELRQLMARFPKEAYIRKQAVACLVNYSYVAKQRHDASLLMKDLEWIQRLWMEHSDEDYLPQALSELASNLIETYEQASSPEEAKVYLALIAGLSSDKPQDAVILSSLGCATSETAWLCERLGDLSGTEQCHQLIESYCDRQPDNAELQKSLISCTLAWLSCLCQKGQLDRAFEIHLRLRYQARRNLGNTFFQFCWGRSCELLIVSHPHHQAAGPLLPLLVAELAQIKSEMPEDPTIWEFWLNSRLHLIWRSLAERDLEAAEDEVVRLSQQIAEHPAAEDLMPYQQKLLLVSVWIAGQQQNWSGLRVLLDAMMNNLRRHPHWILMAQTLAQAGVVAMLAYAQTQEPVAVIGNTHDIASSPTPDRQVRMREANRLLGRLYRLFNQIKGVYVEVEDSVAVWDQFARVVLIWQAYLGSAPQAKGWGGFWNRRDQNQAMALVHKAIRQAESQTVLWSWVTWTPKSATALEDNQVSQPAEAMDRPEAIAWRLTQLMQTLTRQHSHDEVLGGVYRDWLSLMYLTQLGQGQAEPARLSWQLWRKAAGQSQSFRLKAG